jgi:hypothetical protein
MRQTGLVLVASVLLISSVAHARNDVFVHGRNQGPADVANYWHNGGYSDNGITAFTGNNAEGNYVYAYDATKSWSNLASNSYPVCALTQAMYNTPGTDMAVISHSAGGNVSVYMLAVAQNGWANSCSVSPASARAWATYVINVAPSFRGSSVADAVYGQTSGNWFQQTCGSIAGSVANLLFNQTSDMTWGLTTNMMNSNFASMTAYGSYGSIYIQKGSSNKGDDSTGLWWAQYCSNLEGACGLGCTPNNDGFVSQNSAYGCARGTSVGTMCMPYAHTGWTDAVGHSSNRRNDYLSFAANVWANNPY